MRDVAVIMWDEPAVKEVNRNSLGSCSSSERSCADAMANLLFSGV